MPAPLLVLWDLDLTLLDPAGFGTRMIAPVLEQRLGREPVLDVPFAGRTDRAILTALLGSNGMVPDDDNATVHPELITVMDAVAERCERFGHDLLDAGGGPLPGAREAVRALSGDPLVHQGIVTGNMKRTALLKLRLCGFDGLPDPGLGAFGDDHLDRADLVREAVASTRGRDLDVLPGRTVVIGDHVHDVRGALDAGVRFVGVATGRVSAEDLREAGAHVVLPDLTSPRAVVDAVHAACS
ncbi:haloacid dehalogenase [Dietzia sp. NCCP-2495]|nr:haloacid dehalogenase [Dietzia sp. NCCP-2495]